MSVEAIIAAINKTGVAEVIRHSVNNNKLHIVHRVQRNRLAIWVSILDYVLSRKQGWEVHACKQYFRGDGKMKYAWNFIVQWKENQDAILHQIATLFLNAVSQVSSISYALNSYPLAGASKGRNTPEGPLNFKASGYKQRGAHTIGGKK
ncbi:MAG: hypothetical protein ACFFFC_00820 [Candidatus Thorarchaeota archaeon]